ncbi:rhomboid family intramembrane serine protease [Tsukamurella sp. 8F]|uniref:rhomboid family intramembrane serine protease n=1 Tax=unclassified Tsukamurella TaxID=2633480 RepID=UPI0023B89AF1|nr:MULTISPECIES: rhomboid family intramembrane serine protease [unclassified Tsukamurella]MDF0531007.1 rhomboid family intramembrane serine protease [Tsukamurella sp. 8J]MDF0588708.1 rhomboid family intramembrane serine protease [Tsukamurella sp. 8F]
MTSYPSMRPAAVPSTGGRGRAIRNALVTIVLFVGALWLIELVDVADHHSLDRWGILPRTEEGLRGIAFAPLLHAGWDHLASNSVPALVLGFVGLLAGAARFLSATVFVWLFSGAGVWLTGQGHTVTIGLSGVIFGWMTYLVVRGFFNKSIVQILVGVVLLVLYGTMFLGVLPGQPGVSWQAHLFGAIGGVLAAAALGRPKHRTSKQVDVMATG